MFYKYDDYGFFCGTSETETDRCTDVAPPDDDTQQWNWNDVQWIGLPLDFPHPTVTTAAAAAPQVSLTWANAPQEYFWIDVGPFFDRFGAKALAVTASSDPVVQGIITLVLPRAYIDLKRADVSQMLDLLISKSLITLEDKTFILTLHTTDYERHIKGLPQPTV